MLQITIVGSCAMQYSDLLNCIPNSFSVSFIKPDRLDFELIDVHNQLVFIFLSQDVKTGLDHIKQFSSPQKRNEIVLVLTDASFETANTALQLGFQRFVRYSKNPRELANQVREQLSLFKLLQQNNGKHAIELNEDLSTKELTIIELFWKGLSNIEIAIELNVSERTVERHRSNIMKKYKVNSTIELVKTLLKQGILSV
jgi:DNA-binding NarL/FixJ family response regulator